MQQVMIVSVLVVGAVLILLLGYRLGRWHQRTFHTRELVRRRLFAGRN